MSSAYFHTSGWEKLHSYLYSSLKLPISYFHYNTAIHELMTNHIGVMHVWYGVQFGYSLFYTLKLFFFVRKIILYRTPGMLFELYVFCNWCYYMDNMYKINWTVLCKHSRHTKGSWKLSMLLKLVTRPCSWPRDCLLFNDRRHNQQTVSSLTTDITYLDVTSIVDDQHQVSPRNQQTVSSETTDIRFPDVTSRLC
jgi:hypothetical protein